MEYLLKSGAVVAIFYLCYIIFLQKETFFQSNRWFLTAGIILCTLIPFIIIPIYISIEPQQTSWVFNESLVNTNLNHESSINWLQLLTMIYFIGVSIFGFRLCIQFFSLASLILRNKKYRSGKYIHVKVEDNISPFSFFNWIVYNPNLFNDIELEQIITHEKVHAKQYHSIDLLLIQIATVIFWCNPLIWLYKKEQQQNLEFIADSEAQKKSYSEKSYQHLLLKTSMPKYQMALTNNFYNSLIKKRIVMLHKSKSNRKKQWKIAAIIPLMAIFLMSFSTEKIYLQKDTPIKYFNSINEVVIITKDYTDADFEKIKKELKDEGITIKFKGIKRNNKGEIIAIKIEASSEKSNVNYNTNSKEPIKPIKISFNDDSNTISIGNISEMHFEKGHYEFINEDVHKKHKYEVIKKDGSNIVIKKSGNKHVWVTSDIEDDNDEDKKFYKVIYEDSDDKHKKGNVFFIKKHKDGNTIKEEIIIKNGDKPTWLEEDGETIIELHPGNENNTFFFSDEDGKNPLVLLNGKEISIEEMEKLDPNTFENIEILKGDKATEKHGEKAKDGVIIISLKK